MTLLEVLLEKIKKVIVVIKDDNKLIYVPRCKWLKVIDYKVIATEQFVNTTTIYLQSQTLVKLPPILDYGFEE